MDVHGVAGSLHQRLAEAFESDPVAEVDEVSIHPAGKRRLVRVVLARSLAALASEDHTSLVDPLSLDEVAEATKEVNRVLDESEDLLGASPYTLEVSSAGVGAPLRRPAHFRRNVGRLLVLDVSPGEGSEPAGRLTARLVSAGPDGIVVRAEPEKVKGRPTSPPGEGQLVRYDRIEVAKVEVEFTSPPRADASTTNPAAPTTADGADSADGKDV